MVQITDAGLEPTDLTGYVEDLEELLRSIFGQDLDLASETPQGQLAGVLGLYFTNLDELAVHGGNGLNLFKAVGLQLDDMGSLFSLLRIDGEQSTVTATLTGTAGTLVAAGARARTSEGATFASDQPATIGPGGTVDVLFRATQPGACCRARRQLDADRRCDLRLDGYYQHRCRPARSLARERP